MHETQNCKKAGQNIWSNLVLFKFLRIPQQHPALVANDRYADVSENDPKYDAQGERDICWLFVNCMREDTTTGCAYVRKAVQVATNYPRADKVLKYHASV